MALSAFDDEHTMNGSPPMSLLPSLTHLRTTNHAVFVLLFDSNDLSKPPPEMMEHDANVRAVAVTEQDRPGYESALSESPSYVPS